MGREWAERRSWLNVDQSPEELEEVHGAADYYAYLRSPQFVEAFVKPVGAICQRLYDDSARETGRGCPVLDAGCGDGMLADHVGLCPYVGFDGSQAAIIRALSREGRGPGAYFVGRFEDPPCPPSLTAIGFKTLVLSGILEVLVKPECRVPLLEMYRERFGVTHFVICDLERLDTSLLQEKYGPPVEELHRVAENPGGLPEVKLRRKILVFRAGE